MMTTSERCCVQKKQPRKRYAPMAAKPNENNLPYFALCPRSLAKTVFKRRGKIRSQGFADLYLNFKTH
jgi:hypothetical protein